jgi:hypothetical protein
MCFPVKFLSPRLLFFGQERDWVWSATTDFEGPKIFVPISFRNVRSDSTQILSLLRSSDVILRFSQSFG